jgi:O-antigen ligase
MTRLMNPLTPVSGRRRRLTQIVTYAGVAYVGLVTADVNFGRVPLKIVITGVVMAAWLIDARPWRRQARYPSAVAVVLGGVLAPALGFGVAWWLHRHHDPAQHAGFTYAIQQGSRFCYLLLYFPIADEIRRVSTDRRTPWDWLRVHSVWIWAALAVCALTLALYLAYIVVGPDYSSGQVGPFKGSIGVEPGGTFRAFLPTDILLIPAAALGLAMLAALGVTRRTAALMALVLSAGVLIHARGIWLAIAAAGAVVVIGMWTEHWGRAAVRFTAALVAVALAAGLIVTAVPSAARSAASLVVAKHEDSTNKRFDQAPQLLSGFRRHPLLGSGLGATLPSGFKRSSTSPWAFELSYLELLFQLGVVGLAVVLGGPLWMLVKLARRLRQARGAARLRVLAAAASLVGLLLASASNPYLMTSVGMLGLAVAFALSDDGLGATSQGLSPVRAHRLRDPAPARGTRDAPQESEVVAL